MGKPTLPPINRGRRPNTERDAAIIQELANGEDLAVVARRHGITRARALQIRREAIISGNAAEEDDNA